MGETNLQRTSARQGVSEQRALFRLTDRLYRARSLAEAYDAALDGITDLLECPRASILQFDRKGVMRFVAWRGLSDSYRKAVDGHSPWRPGDRDPEPIFIGDIDQTDESDELKRTVRGEGIRALAFVPLTVNSRAVGKFMVYHERPRSFSDDERAMALIIGRQLSFCIERQTADFGAGRLSALIESSSDAIIAKDLNGIIQTWNQGAERLFGYRADEVVGESITILIPEERLDEETDIIGRIRKGERVDHYETVRRRKDGSLVHVSLTVSPIIDASGAILGASKIARDITEQLRARERQELLLREMNHRVKNLFAVTSSIINLNSRTAPSAEALASSLTNRLGALARAHGLTMAGGAGTAKATLHTLAQVILGPYDRGDSSRISLVGEDVEIDGKAVTPMALLLHEFATNAAKYGSLASEGGRLEITSSCAGGEVEIIWAERGGAKPSIPETKGFGSRLVEATVAQLHGRMTLAWEDDGLTISLVLPREHLQ